VKTVVSVQEIAELEIKPATEVAHWRRLVESEIAARWKNRADWISASCPACNTATCRNAFERLGIPYVECTDCGTLYAPKRPGEAALRDWYRESEPSRFWRERLLPVSAAARQEKIVRPRADWVLDGIAEYAPHARRLVDISPQGRPLLDAIAAGAPGLKELVAAGMTADLEGASTARVEVRPSSTRELHGLRESDVVVAVDVMDRAADSQALVGALASLLAPAGVLFATFPVASGFEVQTLWQDSPTIFPPDKLNVPTVDGLLRLFAAPSWEILELSTPGMFDVETVRQAIAAAPDHLWPRIVRALVERTDAAGRESLVEFLQTRRLTSFARLVARRSL
jgi:Zn ribbon nucleic-acid-binding protein